MQNKLPITSLDFYIEPCLKRHTLSGDCPMCSFFKLYYFWGTLDLWLGYACYGFLGSELNFPRWNWFVFYLVNRINHTVTTLTATTTTTFTSRGHK